MHSVIKADPQPVGQKGLATLNGTDKKLLNKFIQFESKKCVGSLYKNYKSCMLHVFITMPESMIIAGWSFWY